MTWISVLPVILWFLITIPLTVFLWKKPPQDKLISILGILAFTLYNLFWLLCVNWSIVGYYLRAIPIICILLITWRNLTTRFLKKPWFGEKSSLRTGLTILLIVGMVGMSILDLFVLRSYQHPAEGVLMLFPLRSGIYVVTNGGNGILGIGMNNYVHKFPWSNGESQPQKAYAVDIMEMTTGGRVGKGILPFSKLDYEIYTEPVYSPCFGQVIYVEDGHTDVDLFEETTELGNYVVIQCVDYYITMGNFRKGTINVAVGERITVNRQVGQVGNSGTPAIPHLHMFATKGGWENGEGEPVPMFFERAFSVDNFLVRNEVQIR